MLIFQSLPDETAKSTPLMLVTCQGWQGNLSDVLFATLACADAQTIDEGYKHDSIFS